MTPDQQKQFTDLLMGAASSRASLLLGKDVSYYGNMGGQSAADWAKSYISNFGDLSGYYDQNAVNQLIGGLGTTSSSAYAAQLRALATDANTLYTYANDPRLAAKAGIENLKKMGGSYTNNGLTISLTPDGKVRATANFLGNVIDGTNDAMEWFGNSAQSLLGVNTSSGYFGAFDLSSQFSYQDWQTKLLGEMNQQQERERNFVSQITGILTTASQNKIAAETAAQQKKLDDEYRANQAALDKQAQANAAKLAEQQAQQQKQYEEAKTAADKQAVQQRAQLNAAATTQAISNATEAAQEQQALAVASLEEQANTVRGGEAIVTTNASTKPTKTTTSRTARWQSTRQPAPGGGGIRT